jgi:hypothetical protein
VLPGSVQAGLDQIDLTSNDAVAGFPYYAADGLCNRRDDQPDLVGAAAGQISYWLRANQHPGSNAKRGLSHGIAFAKVATNRWRGQAVPGIVLLIQALYRKL